jgi:hypothetical protein
MKYKANKNMRNINLKSIAKKFSGIIFFSGDGAVEIMECSSFFIFPSEEELNRSIEGDGDVPEFKSIHKWYEPEHGDECESFNMYSLTEVNHRDTFGMGRTLEQVKSYFKDLPITQQEHFLSQLSKLKRIN